MSGHHGRPGPQPCHPTHPAIWAAAAAIIVLAVGACTSTATTTTPGTSAAAKVGTGKTLNWPVGEGAEGNASVGSTVYRTPFSIGYVEQAYSQGLLLPYAEIRNQAGHYVLPSTQTVAAAAAQKSSITPADFSIVNQPGDTSYPISGYSWALVYTRQPSQVTGQALVSMLDWLTHDGQAYAAANGYVPLPPQIRQLARTTLQQIAGPTGTHLLN
jgi:phosphate transport system substrate-binding protein